MACINNMCKDDFCMWNQFSNLLLQECPRCGGGLINFFDEEADEHESPQGDDYDDPLEDE